MFWITNLILFKFTHISVLLCTCPCLYYRVVITAKTCEQLIQRCYLAAHGLESNTHLLITDALAIVPPYIMYTIFILYYIILYYCRHYCFYDNVNCQLISAALMMSHVFALNCTGSDGLWRRFNILLHAAGVQNNHNIDTKLCYVFTVKGKGCHAPPERRWVLISLSVAIEPVGG